MALQPRKSVAALKTCTHGGPVYDELKELGIAPEEILDFSVSTNPFMPPPGLKDDLKNLPIDKYPDSRSTALAEKLAEKLRISRQKIFIGSGTTEIIRLIALAYFRQNDPVLVIEPTYGEYEVAARIAGARPLKYRTTEKNIFIPDIEQIIDIMKRKRPRAVFLCNPNNPTGKYLGRADIEKVVEALGDTLLVLDEAYVTFVGKRWDSLYLVDKGNVIIMRSMTKDYGLPGLRLGYAVASEEITGILRLAASPWSVNIIAQAAGAAALAKEEYLQQSLLKIEVTKGYLIENLGKLGFGIIPSDAHYFLVKVGNAPECRRDLLKYGIMVRDCTSFGLPEYVRISPRTLPECEKFISAMKKIINQGA